MKDNGFHPAPQWLTCEYLLPILRKYKKDSTLKIHHLDIKPATAKGDNYASIMTRIKVDLTLNGGKQKQKGSYIVKTSFENDPYVASIMSPYDCYKTEMLMYEKVFPKLHQLLKESGQKDKIVADTIHVDYERTAIILEDLAVSNYVTVDRLIGMDFAHAQLALRKLAKMHAAGAVLNERMPGELEKFDHGIFNRHTRGFGVFFENFLQVCANFAGNCKELGPYYKEKLDKLKPHLVEYTTRVYDQRAGFFHTLNHGDFWVNNMMVRYDENNNNNNNNNSDNNNGSSQNLSDLLLIDFQFSVWSPPAVDLHYFFNTSLQNELRFHQQDALIQFYHRELTQTLKDLKFKGYVPTLQELHVQLEAGRFFAVSSSFCGQAVMINDKNDDADFRNLIGDDERACRFRELVYTNKVLQDNVKKLLPFFDRKGLLDVVD